MHAVVPRVVRARVRLALRRGPDVLVPRAQRQRQGRLFARPRPGGRERVGGTAAGVVFRPVVPALRVVRVRRAEILFVRRRPSRGRQSTTLQKSTRPLREDDIPASPTTRLSRSSGGASPTTRAPSRSAARGPPGTTRIRWRATWAATRAARGGTRPARICRTPIATPWTRPARRGSARVARRRSESSGWRRCASARRRPSRTRTRSCYSARRARSGTIPRASASARRRRASSESRTRSGRVRAAPLPVWCASVVEGATRRTRRFRARSAGGSSIRAV
mmetsp:Transcript_12068/g.37173  ORF Transcript_12068/g.37173 Transcript_12068/m.37173 type:complete len:278 (-) Transcript_12068:665-1498(-)